MRFTIRLDVSDASLTGFKAIDRRRALGLPDRGDFTITNLSRIVEFEVTEAFARMWFGNACCDGADVNQEWLMPGELIETTWSGYSPTNLSLAPDLSVDRAKELYIRGETEYRIKCAKD